MGVGMCVLCKAVEVFCTGSRRDLLRTAAHTLCREKSPQTGPRGDLIAKEIKKERKKKRKASDVLETPSLWWLLRLLRLLRLLWLLWLLWLLLSFCSFCGFCGWGSTPIPGVAAREQARYLLLSAVFLVAGMAGKGRETWQLGTWRSQKFVRSCVTLTAWLAVRDSA